VPWCGLPRQEIGAARGHFVRGVGLPLEVGLHEETRFLHPPLDGRPLEEEEIQRDGLAPPLIDTSPLLAQVERQQQEAARLQDAVELGQGVPRKRQDSESVVVERPSVGYPSSFIEV